VQGSLFILHNYLEVKIWILGFFLRSTLKNKLKLQFTHMGTRGSPQGYSMCMAHSSCAWAHDAVAEVRILQFFEWCFEMPWNLGWILPNMYYLQNHSKNHWSSFFISLDPSCGVLLCQITRFNNKITQNTDGVTWFRIKMNYNDLNENNTNCSSQHGQLL